MISHADPKEEITRNLDGTTTESWCFPATEEALRALMGSLFEEHWQRVRFGPCIQGAVFELRFATRPRIGYLDGYLTIGEGGEERWHFHLCVGPHKGTRARPTPPELAAWRRCSRVAFFRDADATGRASSWGLRLWNGRDEQMMTVFFPNPWLDADQTKRVKDPDWSKLALWMELRSRFAGVAPEAPPAAQAARPPMHG